MRVSPCHTHATNCGTYSHCFYRLLKDRERSIHVKVIELMNGIRIPVFKTRLLALLIVTLAPGAASGQWQLISTQGGGEVQFVNSLTGYGLKERTTDGGITWQPMATAGVAAIDFTSPVDGHATVNTVTGPPTYFRTTDGGITWNDMSGVFPGVFGAVLTDFPSADTGYAVSAQVFKTVDGGNSWTTINFSGVFSAHSCRFVDGQTGFLGGNRPPNNPYIFKTNDGGLTWDSVPVPFSSVTNFLTIVYPVSAMDLYAINAVDSTGEILYSDDGGNTWNVQFQGSNMSFHDLEFASPDTGYVVGRNYGSSGDPGLVLRTTDGGSTWNLQGTGYGQSLFRCSFINGLEGWASGVNGDIIHTSNGGTTGIEPGQDEEKAFQLTYDRAAGMLVVSISALLAEGTKASGMEILLFDASARLLARHLLQGLHSSMNVSGLPSGVYLVQVLSGRDAVGRRFVKP